MKVLLTGATGFIGSYILRELLKHGYEILALYRESYDCTIIGCKWLKINDQWIDTAVTFAPDVIIHAAWSGVSSLNRSNWEKQLFNITFQQKLLELRPIQFISLGSQAEYGTFNEVVDELFPATPTSAYGAIKLACLDILKSYCMINNIKWNWFRLFSSFGEGESDDWLIPSTIKKMKISSSMDTTFGEQQYSYLYVGEIARVIVESIKSDCPSGIYNLSSSTTISIKDLLLKIRSIVNPDFILNFGVLPYREGQSMLMGCDNTKTCKYISEIRDSDFEDRLYDTIKSYI